MELTHYSYAAAALAYAALFVAIVLHPRGGGRARRVFASAILASAGWAGVALGALLLRRPEAGVGAAAVDLLRYALWFTWLLLSVVPAAGGLRTLRGGAFATVAGGLVAASLGVPVLAILGVLPSALAVPASRTIALALPVFGLVLVEQFFRNAPESSRWSLKPVCLALALVFAFDVYFYSQVSLFGRVDADALSIRAAVHAASVPFLLIGHLRDAQPDTRFRVSRAAAFHTAALVLAGGYLLFVAALGYYVRETGGTWGAALQIGLLFVAAVFLAALALSESMRAKLRVFVGKNFFSYRYDYRAEWLRFTGMLSASASPQQVGELVIRGLAEMVESHGGALWSRGLDGEGFVQTATWKMGRRTEREPADSAMARFLADKDWIIDLAEHRIHPHRYDDIAMPEWLRASADAWLVVPLQVGDTLIGFVVLLQPRTPVPINWEVRDLLKTASRQAAGFLAQMHATEALLESRKFDAFNRMSAFVVHDLKNIVTQLSLMMKNARRLQDNPEFQQDMLATVDNAVEKMRQLMAQLREGERPADGGAGVPLAPVLRRLADAAAGRGRTVELRIADELAARGAGDRLERVIGHLVQNALEATTTQQRVWLELARDGGRARVVVGDTGSGMTAEFVQTRLFRPFASTKTSGMGIGAYESFQYLRELGGSIAVDSEVGRGTVITITLPLFDAPQRSDLESAVPSSSR